MSPLVSDDTTFNPDLYLSPNEQDLLLTALNSNKTGSSDNKKPYSPMHSKPGKSDGSRSTNNPSQYQHNSRSSLDNNDYYVSPVQQTLGSGVLAVDESPFLDYDLDEGNFDWDVNGDQMIGSLPGTSVDDDDADLHDKRKASDDDVDEHDGGGKRREGDDKTSKKPGRKPLTSEPTSKRKAQNRAAQRAFRERKERHLKELETKVDDLEKASESTNHENGLLRAQVDRLQTEVREYRKQLSMNPVNPASRSPTQGMGYAISSKANWDINSNFQFDFPMFGGTPKTGTTNGNSPRRATNGNPSNSSPTVLRKTSSTTSQTPLSHPARTTSQSQASSGGRSSVNDLSDLFSPSVLQSVSRSNSTEYPRYNTYQPSSEERADPIRGSLSSNGASPSASSVSQTGINSSCGTTPETSAESPDQRKASEAAFSSMQDGTVQHKPEGETTFCKEFAKACGTKENPVPLMMSHSDEPSASSTAAKTPGLDFHGIDWMASQNGGAFDPVLFADYRDPQENIMNGDFGNFFDEAFPALDFTPSAAPLEPALHRKRDLMQQIDDQAAGEEPEVVPGGTPKQFLTCNMLWDRVQRSEKVQNGEADMDDLCTQLKSKAKCSGSGAVIEQKDVDAILGPAPDEQNDFLKMFK
ncbi:DNA-binding transcription factor yap1 [Lambiella insularis]|nr:DNA-binding transcription factor yap1 [Lambiella insularis]